MFLKLTNSDGTKAYINMSKVYRITEQQYIVKETFAKQIGSNLETDKGGYNVRETPSQIFAMISAQ